MLIYKYENRIGKNYFFERRAFSIVISILIGGLITLIVLLKNSTNNSQENENIINEKKPTMGFKYLLKKKNLKINLIKNL